MSYNARMPAWAAAIAVAGSLLAGCGQAPGTVPVSGEVTFQGGRVPGPGKIMFAVVQQADGFPNRPVVARFDADGNYQAMSGPNVEGVYPGSYKISVECWKTPPNLEGKPVENFVNKRFNHPQTSGLELEIEPGSDPITYNIDLEP